MTLQVGRCLLTERLNDAKMTQQELADKSGISKAQISHYVHGVRQSMSLRTAVIISDVLHCSPRDLYEWIPACDEARRR